MANSQTDKLNIKHKKLRADCLAAASGHGSFWSSLGSSLVVSMLNSPRGVISIVFWGLTQTAPRYE